MIKMYKNEDRPLVLSDFMFGSWLSVMIVSIGIGVGIVVSLDLSAVADIFLIAVTIFVSIYISSYFFLNRAAFFSDRIEINYVIKHGSKRKAIIDISNVYLVKYVYIGGKGSAGNGQLKVYYKVDGQENHLKCSMDNSTAAKLCSSLQKQNMNIEIKPPLVLNKYGYTAVNKNS